MSEKDNIHPILKTSCCNCTFRENGPDGKQVGCELQRIAKFKERGATVVEKDDYLVIDRVCNALRTQYWADHQGYPMEAVRKEITFQCDILILVPNDKIFKHADICLTVDDAFKQSLSPKTVRVVTNNRKINKQRVYDYLVDVAPEHVNYYLDSVKLLDEKNKPVNRLGMIDVAVGKATSTYYAVFTAGSRIPEHFLRKIDNALNTELLRFCLLEANEAGEGLVVQRQLHNILFGNRAVILEADEKSKLVGDEIVGKAKYIAEKNGNLDMIQKVTDICPELTV